MADRATTPNLPDDDLGRWARHSPYSDPGAHADLLASVPGELEPISAVARNLIVHYRASGLQLPEATREDINARWLATILDLDQQRHPGTGLAVARTAENRVQGCCRDHSLFAAAALRQRGRPARIRYGFAHYFLPDFHVDHVVVETWQPELRRWRRFDPEVEHGNERIPDPLDIPFGPGAPFSTAAEVWADLRAGRIHPEQYGVGPDLDIGGGWFIQSAVIIDAAFRAGHELLLWDGWQAMSGPDGPTDDEARRTDEVADLIRAADDGDTDAEAELLTRVEQDPAVGPPTVVQTMSPWGDPPRETDLSLGPAPGQPVHSRASRA